ncbi:MAG: hypothetical protein U0X92_15405, partial [Anaerolineales bacterium]
DQQRAIKYLVEWVEKNKIQPEKKVDLPRGVYLPLWTFDLGGEIRYTGEVIENTDDIFGQGARETRMRRVSDSYPVLINDLPIPAARKLSGVFQQLIPTFELKAVKPYEAGYLANWPAEVYDIPMAEASLDARVQALARYKRELPAIIAPARLISTSSSNMMVESFRLTLLPVWMTELPFGGREHLVLINGWTGETRSDLPEKESSGLMEWLGDLIEG